MAHDSDSLTELKGKKKKSINSHRSFAKLQNLATLNLLSLTGLSHLQYVGFVGTYIRTDVRTLSPLPLSCDCSEAKLQLANGLLYYLRQYFIHFILDLLNKPAEKNQQWGLIL